VNAGLAHFRPAAPFAAGDGAGPGGAGKMNSPLPASPSAAAAPRRPGRAAARPGPASLGLRLLVAFFPVWLAAPAPPAAAAPFEREVRRLIAAADLADSVEYAVVAVDLATGRPWVALAPDRPLIPASNQKLITSAVALDVLGPDFLFTTRLRHVPGNPERLLVIGDGDPAFGDRKLLEAHGLGVETLLEKWVAAARRATNGPVRLEVDDRIFEDRRVHPDWPRDQLNRWYCAEVAGLNFHTNTLDLFPRPAGGRRPVVRLRPDAAFIETENRATTGERNAFWIERPSGTNKFIFRGSVRHEHREPLHVTVHDPALFFGRVFADRLRGAGLEVNGVHRRTSRSEAGGRDLHRVRTTLRLVLERMNKDSQNLFAEALAKRVAHEVTGRPGRWSDAARIVPRRLARRLGSVEGLEFADGSGMSRGNRLTAGIITRLLAAMHRDERLGALFRDSLSIAGEDGTLAGRYGGELTGRIYGKTGYIRGVSTLSGYLYTGRKPPEGPAIAFSFLFNGFSGSPGPVRALQDRLVEALAEHARRRAAQAP